LFGAAIPLARRMSMADNKDQIGGSDRSRASGSEEYEVRHFAKAIGLDAEKVRKLIQRHDDGGGTPESDARKPTSH
jgi:hypothetical protein